MIAIMSHAIQARRHKTRLRNGGGDENYDPNNSIDGDQGDAEASIIRHRTAATVLRDFVHAVFARIPPVSIIYFPRSNGSMVCMTLGRDQRLDLGSHEIYDGDVGEFWSMWQNELRGVHVHADGKEATTLLTSPAERPLIGDLIAGLAFLKQGKRRAQDNVDKVCFFLLRQFANIAQSNVLAMAEQYDGVRTSRGIGLPKCKHDRGVEIERMARHWQNVCMVVSDRYNTRLLFAFYLS